MPVSKKFLHFEESDYAYEKNTRLKKLQRQPHILWPSCH